MKHFLLFLFTVLFFNSSKAQNIDYSDQLQISILTCGTGNELYSQFGHSAIRVKDLTKGFDVVYNYGIFDFSDPNFYTNFAKGKLIYKIGYSPTRHFFEQYQWENRSVKEQVLQLNSNELIKIVRFLQNNAKPENAKYQYDFLANNCATKIIEVLNTNLNNEILYDYSFTTHPTTFRDLINDYVPHNSWSNLGINIALGSVIDNKLHPKQFNFLPDYVYLSLHNAQLNNTRLIAKSETILEQDPSRIVHNSIIESPLFVFGLLALVILYLTYKDYKNQKTSSFLNGLILFTTGIIGVFVCLLWFATNHTATVNNFNILWANPLNLLALVLFYKNKKWKKTSYLVNLVLVSVAFIISLLGIQPLALAILPLLITIYIRYIYLALKL